MQQAGTGQPTHCPYCALQCAMTVTAGSHDGGARVDARDFPTNKGGLCRKGWSAAELLDHPDRLTAPLVRDAGGVLREASWDTVLRLVSDRVRSIQARHGRDAVAVFGGGGLTNEKAYTLGKFARLALRTSRIDYNGRFCMSSAAAAGNRAFGVDRGLPFPLEDLGAASVVLLLGSNAADTMPPFIQHLRGAQAAGGLVVVDPRRSATARLTDQGRGVHLQPTPGTDLALLLGLAHVVVAEGLEDRRFLEARTTGYDDVARGLARWWPERVQGITGVPAASLRAVARVLAEGARRGADGGPGAYILTGRGIEQHADGTDTTTAAINLSLLLGLPGTAHSGYGTLTGQGNGQGGREHGQKSDQLPGYRKITDPVARAHVAAVWGVPEESIPGPGLPAVELLGTLGKPGGTRCLFVHGANVAVSAPDAASVIDGLRSLDLLVVSDFFLSETAALADVVLPVLQWAEEEGTVTNLEGRVLRRRPAVEPPPVPAASSGSCRNSRGCWTHPPCSARTRRPCSTSSPGRAPVASRTIRDSTTACSTAVPRRTGRTRRAARARRGCSSTPSPTPAGGPCWSPSSRRPTPPRPADRRRCSWPRAGSSSTTSPVRRRAAFRRCSRHSRPRDSRSIPRPRRTSA